MAEYIEREALRNAVRSKTMTKYDWSEEIDFEDFENVLDGIPAADVAPVVHGRWINGVIEREPVIKNGRVYRNDTPTFQCSECKETFAGITYGFSYCPNCGARMDGE